MFRDQKTYHVYDAYSLYPLHVDVSELKAFSSNWQQVELDEVMDDTYTKYWDTLFEIKEGKCTFSFNTGELIHRSWVISYCSNQQQELILRYNNEYYWLDSKQSQILFEWLKMKLD